MSEALALLRRMAAAPPHKRSYFTGAEAAELLAMIERPAKCVHCEANLIPDGPGRFIQTCSCSS